MTSFDSASAFAISFPVVFAFWQPDVPPLFLPRPLGRAHVDAAIRAGAP